MSKPYYFKRREKAHYNKPEDDPFQRVEIYLPKSLYYILKAKSDAVMMPVSRLIAWAIDNELEVPESFYYPCPWPESVFVDFAYAEEAKKIMTFLEKFPNGLGRDLLMLLRRDIGIPNKSVFMLALRELFENKIIEEFRPNPKKTKFQFHSDYKFIRIIALDPLTLRKNKYKKVGGVDQRWERPETREGEDDGEPTEE